MKRENNYYQKSVNELYQLFNSSVDGLSDESKRNNKKYGTNSINERKRKSFLVVFLEQFNNLLVIVLLIASILSLFTKELENTIVILVVLFLNAILGTVQYFKAEKSLASLKKLSSLKAKVLRNKKIETIDSIDIVCGDVILIKSGDVLVSDGRLIEANNLEIDESVLTGESITTTKDSDVILNDVVISEQKNMVFRGTKVISGKGKYLCTSVGMDTEIGKIAKMLSNVKRKKSPLEINIDKFSRQLAFLILSICIVVFFMSIYRGITPMDSLIFSISLAVAAIPEALQTIVTIVLAISTEKMAKEKAIVKDIKSIETLGNIDVICTDKTGTITQNKMVVKDIKGYNDYNKVINCLSICNDRILDNNNTINTDQAIINYLIENNVDLKKIDLEFKKIKEIPFSSKLKYCASLVNNNQKNYIYVKGGSDVILDKCNYFNGFNKNYLKKMIDEESNKGYRVLALAYKEVNTLSLNESDICNLTFIGIITLLDPPKEGVKSAINECISYNVKPIMITGDNLLTAKTIGKEVGIYHENDLCINGDELKQLNDKELKKIIDNISIYARVTPSDKIRIVTLLQEKGHNVAFLGDGVNDAPALKKADVGVAMGINGTDVSKEASSVILMDDNYQTIVSAIKKGRKIYQNIQNAILYLIAGNIAGIFLVLYTTIFNLPMPFSPVHLLFINLINDSLPAIAIGIEEKITSVKDILQPRNVKEGILTNRIVKRITIEGMIIAFCCIATYHFGYLKNIFVARTMVFVTISIARLFYSFNCIGRFSIFKRRRYKKGFNKTLFASIFVGLALIFGLLFIPQGYVLFNISPLSNIELIISFGLGLIPLLSIQFIFIVRELKYQKNNKKLILNIS